jgi:tRNA(adenine34) deaminase
VTTLSTFPPAGLFARSAEVIAETMARPDVSPGGLGGAIRMVTFFVNRAGRTLPETRRAELDRAKQLLHERRAGLEVVPAARREAGRYRHLTLGAVMVRRRGRRWEMLRDGAPAIALGPDGWRYLERA